MSSVCVVGSVSTSDGECTADMVGSKGVDRIREKLRWKNDMQDAAWRPVPLRAALESL
jgi:hypothetical protein